MDVVRYHPELVEGFVCRPINDHLQLPKELAKSLVQNRPAPRPFSPAAVWVTAHRTVTLRQAQGDNARQFFYMLI